MTYTQFKISAANTEIRNLTFASVNDRTVRNDRQPEPTFEQMDDARIDSEDWKPDLSTIPKSVPACMGFMNNGLLKMMTNQTCKAKRQAPCEYRGKSEEN